MNYENYVKIPLPFQTVVDDIGWFNGNDERHIGMPSRTGMPRYHVAKDYRVMNEIGKRINQKICGAFVIGEWDKNNRMTGEEHMTKFPDKWDCRSTINMPEAERCFEEIESSDYIEIALHGLLHSFWDEEMGHDDQQYYIRPRSGYTGTERMIPVPDDYFEKCIDKFIEIYKDWGFTKELRTFISPGSAFGPIDDNRSLARILKGKGFKYWSNYWAAIKKPCEIIEGITFLNKGTGLVPWNAYDVNPALINDYSIAENDGLVRPMGVIFGLHWPNYLKLDPEKNLEGVDAWVDFYRRQANIFGIMISRDMEFAAHQAQYARFTEVTFTENEVILDFESVDKSGAIDIGDEVYVSMANHLRPLGIMGGVISLYETQQRFRTYKIKRQDKTVKIKVK